MKVATILLLLTIGFSNFVFCQIKSKKAVAYFLHKEASKKGFHKNTSKDRCVIFWEEYNRNGKITKKYDFPSDRCWKNNGPWEHHYIYDTSGRLIERNDFGGEEGKTRILMTSYFYSYPYLNEPNIATAFYIKYNYKSKIDKERADTFYLDTVDTRGMFIFSRTTAKQDTIRFKRGRFIFNEIFERDKNLFKPSLILPLLGKNSIKDFETALLNNIVQISNELFEIYNTGDHLDYQFRFEEEGRQIDIAFNQSKNSIEIVYKFLNQYGDCNRSFFYECNTNGENLKKLRMVESDIEYY